MEASQSTVEEALRAMAEGGAVGEAPGARLGLTQLTTAQTSANHCRWNTLKVRKQDKLISFKIDF